MPEDVAEAVVAQARSAGRSTSAWVTDAVYQRLSEQARLEIGRRAAEELVEEWEARHGPISAEARADGDPVSASALGED